MFFKSYDPKATSIITSYGPTNFKKVGIFVLACSNLENFFRRISQVLYIQEPDPLTDFFGALKQHFEKRLSQYSSKLFEAKVYKRDIIIGLKERPDRNKPLLDKPLLDFTFLSERNNDQPIMTIPMSYEHPPLAGLNKHYTVVLHAKSITDLNKTFTAYDYGKKINAPTSLTFEQANNIVSELYIFDLSKKITDIVIWFTKNQMHYFRKNQTNIVSRPMPTPFNPATDIIIACAKNRFYNVFFVAYERIDPKTQEKSQFVQVINMADFIESN
jgi:hypothetical protein